MRTLSSTCLAIALADKRGTLQVYERVGRFGTHAVIADERGIIETPDSMAEATTARVADLRQRAA